MWIETQDKCSLLKCEEFYILKNGIYTSKSGRETELGLYDNKERAIEILKQIKIQLIKCTSLDVIYCNKRYRKEFVFQMPDR